MPRLAGHDDDAGNGEGHAERAAPAELVVEEDRGDQRRERHLDLDRDRRRCGVEIAQAGEHQAEMHAAEGEG